MRPLAPGTRIELNRLFDMGNLQHDGAAINVGTSKHAGCLVVRNWAYDCNRQGVRFDYHGGWNEKPLVRDDGLIHGDGVYMNNVTWNTQPNQVKGDRHLVLGNTVVNVNRYRDPKAEEMTMSIQGFKCMHNIDGNESSRLGPRSSDKRSPIIRHNRHAYSRFRTRDTARTSGHSPWETTLPHRETSWTPDARETM